MSISYLDYLEDDIDDLTVKLNTLERHSLDETLWINSLPRPEVSFTMAYSDTFLIIKFFVEEPFIRVTQYTDNSPVYLDSCVEFFISFGNEPSYYNFEFNSIGVCAAGFGNGRSGRSQIKGINRIKRQSSIASYVENGTARIHWELSALIPFEVFAHHQIRSLADVQCRANFYKCGDALPNPHFLAWKKVVSDTPNFHLPLFFGLIHFVKPCSVYQE